MSAVRFFSLMLLGIFAVLPACTVARAADEPINYTRDIRPILSNSCYACHGPDADKREAELRFDTAEAATKKLDSGGFAVVPGNLAKSVLYQRLVHDDEDERMPPADSGKTITPQQIALIKKWIEQGGNFEGHWSLSPIKRPAEPKLSNAKWARGAIDRFVSAKLQKEGLSPSREADKPTLIRRVTFDLTGLPPTLTEIDDFLADKSPGAYDKVVDRLLKSPRYGEHMGRQWLDLARYGDTHGLHLDSYRSIWPYRDWVIKAFNKNMRFDQFTVEQMAGDLLPSATMDQKIATGFGRCNVTTSEGGSIKEEYRVRYSVDRVETMGTVWLGLSLGCAVCHDHKFDPISMTEFYQLYAYFYNFAENEMDGNSAAPKGPLAKITSPASRRKKQQLTEQIAAIEAKINAQLAAVQYKEPVGDAKPSAPQPEEFVWIDDAVPAGAKAEGDTPWQFVASPKPVFSGKSASFRKAKGRSQHYFTGASQGLKIEEGDRLFTYVYLDPKDPPKQIMLQFNDGSWEHRVYWGENLIPWGKPNTAGRVAAGKLPEAGKWVLLEIEPAKVGLKVGAVLNGWAFTQFDGSVYWDKAGVVHQRRRFDSLAAWQEFEKDNKKSSLSETLRAAIALGPAKCTAEQKQQLRDHFLRHVYPKTRDAVAPLQTQITQLRRQVAAINTKPTITTLIMGDLAKTDGRWKTPKLLTRGQYDQPAKEVKRGVPAAVAALPKGAPNNRLGLAQWLVDRNNPLPARVSVNRFWQQYFGTGIVKTAEDFGSQGEWPSNLALLDWLAAEFIESGWDVKHMQKLIVTSAAYRQSAVASPEAYKRDKDNRLISRGPRFRLDSEMIRDSALALSGLLVEKLGGPSVKPYQPAGIWKAVGYTSSNTANFKQDKGEALYRRSMYTFWKRTAPPPSMQIFDAPSRENCTARRERTNTPLQALTLMNDIQFVEAARHLAQRMLREGGKTSEEQITFAFRLATGRRPDAVELGVLVELYKEHLKEFTANKDAANKLINVGDSKPDKTMKPEQLAALTMIGNLILNLDETVTKG